MNSENTRAYLAFALVGLMFVLVIALFLWKCHEKIATKLTQL